jgi:hypothetical protein
MNERIALIALAAFTCIAIARRVSFWKPLLLGLWYWLWS